MEVANAIVRRGESRTGLHRAGATRLPARSTSAVNVSPTERVVSAAFGWTLLMLGFRRRSLGGAAMALTGGELLYRGITGRCPVYQALGISTAEGRKAGAPADAMDVEQSITIGRSADELYRLWRDPENLPRIMGHFAEVTATSYGRAHWTVRGPLGWRMAWDTQLVEDRPGELLRWKSLEGAGLPNEGAVRFHSAPRDWGTEVTLRVRFDPPGGALGDVAVKVLDFIPRIVAEKALRRFKSLAETGEIPTTEHQPAARAVTA